MPRCIAVSCGSEMQFSSRHQQGTKASQMSCDFFWVSHQDAAALSYANREFGDAVGTLNELVARQPDSPRWYEMRAQVRRTAAAFVMLTLYSAYGPGWTVHPNNGSNIGPMLSQWPSPRACCSNA